MAMKFKLEIECNSAAFELLEMEVSRMLHEAEKRLAEAHFSGERLGMDGEPFKLRDINGNTVGSFEFTEER